MPRPEREHGREGPGPIRSNLEGQGQTQVVYVFCQTKIRKKFVKSRKGGEILFFKQFTSSMSYFESLTYLMSKEVNIKIPLAFGFGREAHGPAHELLQAKPIAACPPPLFLRGQTEDGDDRRGGDGTSPARARRRGGGGPVPHLPPPGRGGPLPAPPLRLPWKYQVRPR